MGIKTKLIIKNTQSHKNVKISALSIYLGLAFVFFLNFYFLHIFHWHMGIISERGGAERRILVPGCDGVGGSAGEPCLFVCLSVCLFVCLSVCLFRVGRGLLALPNTK